jgi:hypothetical protein
VLVGYDPGASSDQASERRWRIIREWLDQNKYQKDGVLFIRYFMSVSSRIFTITYPSLPRKNTTSAHRISQKPLQKPRKNIDSPRKKKAAEIRHKRQISSSRS